VPSSSSRAERQFDSSVAYFAEWLRCGSQGSFDDAKGTLDAHSRLFVAYREGTFREGHRRVVDQEPDGPGAAVNAGGARQASASEVLPSNACAVIVPAINVDALPQSHPPIYDRPIGLRLLYTDPATGGDHYMVYYPPGLRTAWHHHSAAHTIVLIDGALEANGVILEAGSYCHFPAMTPMLHQPAGEQHCRFITIFSGPFDVFLEQPDQRHCPLRGT
jgi:quercetin dioxygenase-like cupin family protein